MSFNSHLCQAILGLQGITVPASGNINFQLSTAQHARINVLFLVTYAASSASGISIAETYGIDISSSAAAPYTLVNPLIDTVTAPIARGPIPATAHVNSVYQGILQFNLSTDTLPGVVNWKFTNNDTQVATIYGYLDTD